MPLAAAAALALALSACGGGGSEQATTEITAEPTATTAQEESTEPTADATTTAPVTYDVEAVDLGEPGETDPGSTLALGEPAWVTSSVTVPDADEPVAVPLGLSLLQISEGDPGIWADWDNAEEFDGYTPYLLVLQYVFPEGLPDGVEEPPTPAIFPILEDGTGAGFIQATTYGIGGGASDECGYQLQGWDPATSTLVMCAVGLSDGGPVTGGLFNGDAWSAVVTGMDEVYGSAPIVWEG